jgi:hypothetical protein
MVALMVLLGLIQGLILPVAAAEMAATAPEFAFLRWPLLILAEFMLLVADVVLIALIGLLSLVRRRVIFSRRALWRVNLIIGGIWAEVVCCLGWVWVLVFVTGGPPLLTLMAIVVLVAGPVAAIGVTAMRGLLTQATAQADELSAVI